MPEYPHIDVSKLLHCGVYCLLQRGKVVYVGKSKNPIRRLRDHMQNRNCEMPDGRHRGGGGSAGPTYNGRGIKFDGIWFVPCMLGQLDTIEAVLIKKHLPKYNIKGMPRQPIPLEIRELLREMGWVTGMASVEPTAPQRTYITRRL